MTTVLESAFDALKQVERVNSQYDFSSNWCGRSRSYLSWTKAAKAKPSIHALTMLLFRINAEIKKLNEKPDPFYPEVTEYDLQKLNEIKELVSAELERQCLPS